MSLEEQLAANTAALTALTAAIGAMQAPGPVDAAPQVEETRGGLTHEEYQSARIPKRVTLTPKELAEDVTAIVTNVTNAKPEPSSDTTSGEQSQPTGESSSPELDYAKDVKPITIRLSKEKGRELTLSVLGTFNVQSAQQLAPGQWASYIATCEKVLAGGEV